MAKKVRFDVKSRPTKERPGRTEVNLEIFGKDGAKSTFTPLGYIAKDRGVATYPAYDREDNLIGNFDTRSKAGHALERNAAK